MNALLFVDGFDIWHAPTEPPKFIAYDFGREPSRSIFQRVQRFADGSTVVEAGPWPVRRGQRWHETEGPINWRRYKRLMRAKSAQGAAKRT